LYSRAPAFHFS